MSLIPLVDLDHLAALLGIRTWHPADDDDLAVLAELVGRRAVAAERTPGMLAPAAPPSRRTGTLEVMAATEDAALDLRTALASANAALSRAEEAAKGLASKDESAQFAAQIDQVRSEVVQILKRAGGAPPRGSRR